MSQPVTFEPGTQYVLQGVGYQITQVLHDGTLVAHNLATNTYVSHRLDQLWQHWQDNTLQFERSGPNLQDIAGTTLKTTYTFADLVDLPAHLQEITWHRYQLIRPLVDLPSRQRTKQVVEERIRTYLATLERERAQGKHTFLFGQSVGQATRPWPRTSQAASVPQDPAQTTDPSPSNADRPPAHQKEPLDLTPRTVSRWLRRYQTSHQDIRSLVPSYHLRGPHQGSLHPFLETLLQQAIQETYLTNVRAPVTHVITSFKKLIITENTKRSPEEQLPTPGNMTVYRYLQRMDAEEVESARFGSAHGRRSHHQSEQGPLPTRPNQRAEFDFAQLDLLVVDPVDRLPIGRPTLAAIRDKYTGYPLGIFVSFDPPSYRLVMECLLYAILPKNHVQSLFQTQHAYLAFGVPEVLVVDNAIELDRDLELACLQLGIELSHMPIRKPWFKGSVERWFRTLNTDLIHVIPGTTFSHFLERGEYDSQKHACITLDRLWELLHLWIVDVYTQEVRKGVGGHPQGKGLPAHLWQRALDEQFVPRVPPSRNDLLVLLTRTTTRKVHHYGIEFENLLYQSHDLAPLRSKLAQAKHYLASHSEIAREKQDAIKAGIVSIKYHPGDLSRIWVLDPFSDEYICILAIDQHYTADLSLWKHQVIKRYTQQELKRQVDTEALVLAKARLQQFVTEEMRLTRKIRSRQSLARWWNEQVTTWIDQATHTSSAHLSLKAAASPPPTTPDTERTPLPFQQPRSAADLSAPLPQVLEHVTIPPDTPSDRDRTPFSAFPPLPIAHQSGETHPSMTPQPSARPQTKELALAQGTTDARSSSPESPSTNLQQTPIPLSKRQKRFGIEVRSTPWE
jgi:putative transposase